MPPAHLRLVLTTTILASSLAFIDGSVVNVGLPAIGRSLDADGAALSWVINAYLLPLSALLLIGGAAGDRYGRRAVLIVGVALFAVASLLCLAAPSIAWLIAGRVLQGIGAAMLMPNSLAILGTSFKGEARGRAIGTWSAVGAAAAAIGPLLGGWLIDLFGWRAVFLINLPIAAVTLILATRYVARDDGNRRHALDIVGALLATAGLTAMTFGLTSASAHRGLDAPSSLVLAGGVALLIFFIIVEARRGAAAMMPLGLFSSSSFAGLTLLTLLLYGALSGVLVLVPYMLIEQQGYSAIMAGAALLPLPVVIALGSSAMGQLAGRIGARLPLTIGPVVVAIGCLLLTRIDNGGSYWITTFPAMVVIALGMSAAVAPLTTAVLASVDPQRTGIASGFNSAIARSGGLIATALSSVILASQGTALIAAFHIAAWAGMAAALAAGACTLLFVAK